MRHDRGVLEPTFRPLITVIRLTPDRSSVEVVLDLEGRKVTGVGHIRDDDSMRAACEGTIAAVLTLLPDHMRLELEWYHLLDRGDQPDVVNSAVVLSAGADHKPEHLVGAAYVRHDPDVAAVRATLDGMKRRLVGYLFD